MRRFEIITSLAAVLLLIVPATTFDGMTGGSQSALAATRDDTLSVTTTVCDTIDLERPASEFMLQSIDGAFTWYACTQPTDSTYLLIQPDSTAAWHRKYFYISDGAMQFERFRPPYPTAIILQPVDASAVYRMDAR